jgi:hypothetical protein
MLIIISPKGKVIKAERPNFLIEAREKKSVEVNINILFIFFLVIEREQF